MIIKTNSFELAKFCEELALDVDLLIDKSDGVDKTPFIFVQGDAVEKMIELTKSPKARMILNMLI